MEAVILMEAGVPYSVASLGDSNSNILGPTAIKPEKVSA